MGNKAKEVPMSREKQFLFLCAALLIWVVGCTSATLLEGPIGPAGPAGQIGPAGPSGESATAAQKYVGSEVCANCHQSEYEKFILSGHPYKLTKVENGQPPSYPYDHISGGVSDLPQGYSWDDISYVIGGFAWKVRFVDQQGFVITGDADSATQFNYANSRVDTPAQWVPYRAGRETPYDCGACHTTGYRAEGNQDELEGMVGVWAFPGVQCERCHGPGSGHSEDPYGVKLVVERASQACGQCHSRNDPAHIDSAGGFIRHHESYEELYSSKHFALSCITCHDPHASAVFADPVVNPNQGIRQSCDSCHWQQLFSNNTKHRNVTCVDCHMPPMVQTAAGDAARFKADIRSHLFSINPDPEAPQFRDEGAFAMPYITLSYACLQCHNGDGGRERDLETLAKAAAGYHTRPTATPLPQPTPEPEATPTPEP
jgi:hypothetical protein